MTVILKSDTWKKYDWFKTFSMFDVDLVMSG